MSEYATIERLGKLFRVITPAGKFLASTGAEADLVAGIVNAAYAAGRASAESKWHPVSEPPNDGRMVEARLVMFFKNGWTWPTSTSRVAHWRELPAPPETAT